MVLTFDLFSIHTGIFFSDFYKEQIATTTGNPTTISLDNNSNPIPISYHEGPLPSEAPNSDVLPSPSDVQSSIVAQAFSIAHTSSDDPIVQDSSYTLSSTDVVPATSGDAPWPGGMHLSSAPSSIDAPPTSYTLSSTVATVSSGDAQFSRDVAPSSFVSPPTS
mgnify:CR=1 FL=1